MTDDPNVNDSEAPHRSAAVYAPPSTCANCGGPIDTSRWHPIVTHVTDDGSIDLYSFCDDSCEHDWRDR